MIRYFCCWCYDKNKGRGDEINLQMDYEEEDELINGVSSLFPNKYIREDEKNHIKITSNDITNYLNELSQQKIKSEYDEENLKLSILNENELSDNTPVIRSKIVINKSSFTKNILILGELMMPLLIPEHKLKFDKNLQKNLI
jgi:hypothetical protein